MKLCELQQVVQEVQRRELSGQENLVWNTDLIKTVEFENLIGQAAQNPYSDGMCNESRGTRESRRFPERNNEQLMKHILTIGSQTREGSTGCVEGPRGDRSTVGRSDEPCVASEDAARRLQSQPSAQEKSKPAARARSEFKRRSDASETDPISSTADAVRRNQQKVQLVKSNGEQSCQRER